MSVSRDTVAIDFLALDDAALVVQIRRGEREAFRHLMQRCNQRVYRVLRGVLDDESEIEDVMQEAYVKVFEKLDGFRGEASLATWVCRIALNEAFARLRRRRPSVDIETLDEGPFDMANVISFPRRGTDNDPLADTARQELHKVLEQAVSQLPPAFRSVFLLREVEGCSIEETADLLAIRGETVKTRLHRAKRLLRQMLQERAESVLGGTFPFMGRRCERVTDAVLLRLAERWTFDN